MRSTKSQSAIEYLMTYGWAILVIAIAIGILYQLGAFGSNNFVPRAQGGACSITRTSIGTSQIASLTGVCSGQLPQYVGTFNALSSTYATFNNPVFEGDSFTISMWMELGVKSGANQAFMASSGAPGCNTDNALLLGTNVGTGNTNYYMGFQSDDISNSVNVFTVGRWYMVTTTWNNVTKVQSLYVNGSLNTQRTSTGLLNTRSNYIAIGSGTGTCWGSSWFNGMLSNVQIYNTTLTANDVKSLYLEGIGGTPLTPINVVEWMQLNGNVNDYSGYNNPGAASGVLYTSQWTSGYVNP